MLARRDNRHLSEYRILQAMQDRKTSMPLTAPQTIPFGETLQKNVSRNLSEATRRGSVSKQGN